MVPVAVWYDVKPGVTERALATFCQ